MTTNKQDELRKSLSVAISEPLQEVRNGAVEWHLECEEDIRTSGYVLGDGEEEIRHPEAFLLNVLVKFINYEISQVLNDLLEHRSLLSDPQHGEKSVPVSVIKAKLKEYESE